MTVKPEFKRLRSPIKLGLLFAYPVLLLAALYVSVFLYGNSRHAQTLITNLVSSVIPGRLEVGELRLDPKLNGAILYGVGLFHPGGWEQIGADSVEASVDLLSLVRGNVDLTRVLLDRPRVLVSIDEKGAVEIGEMFADLRSGDPRPTDPEEPDEGRPVTVRLHEIRLSDGEVLVHLPEMSILVRHVYIDDCRLGVHDEEFSMVADVAASDGRVLILPELFELVDPKASDHLREHRHVRQTDRWRAAEAVLPTSFGPEFGALTVDFSNLDVERFRWRGEGFHIAQARLNLDGRPVTLTGGMEVLDDKEATIAYNVRGEIALSPSSSLLSYFTQGLLSISEPPPVTSSDSDSGETSSPGSTPGGVFRFDIQGTLAAIGGNLDLEIWGLRIAEWTLDHLSVRATTQPGGLWIFEGPGISARIDQGSILAEGRFQPANGTYSLDLWLDGIDSTWLFRPWIPHDALSIFAGVVATRPSMPQAEGEDAVEPPGIHVEGDLDSKSFPDFLYARLQDDHREEVTDLAEVQINRLTWERDQGRGLPFRRLALSGVLKLSPGGTLGVSGGLAERDFSVLVDQNQIQARGNIDLLSQTFDDLRVRGDVDSLADLLSTEQIEARVATILTLNGSFVAPSVQVHRLGLRDLLAGGIEVGNVLTSFRSDLALGAEGLPRLERGELTLNQVDLGRFGIDEIRASYTFDGERLEIWDTTLLSAFGRIDLSGDIRLARNGEPLTAPILDLQARAAALDLAALLGDQPVAGSISVRADITGSTARPQVEGTIELSDAILFEEWIDRVSADFSYSNRGIAVTDIVIRAEDGVISGEVCLDRDGRLQSAHLQTSGLQLEHFRHVADLGLDIRGAPEIDIEVISPHQIERVAGLEGIYPAPGLPDIQGSVIVRDFTVQGMNQGALALSIDTYGDLVSSVGWLSRDLQTRLSWPLSRNRPVVLHTTFDHLPLENTIPGLQDAIERGQANDGVLRAELRLLERLEILADLSLGELWLETAGRRFSTARPIHITYSAIPAEEGEALRHEIHIPEFSFGAEGHYVSLRGDILDWSDLNLHLLGDLDLSLASMFTSAIAEANGVVEVSLDLGGTLSDPAPQGRITLHSASVAPRGLGDEVLLREGQIRIYPYWYPDVPGEHQMTLEIPRDHRIEGTLFEGAFALDGEVHFDHFVPHDLQLELFATNVSYRIPDMISLTLNRVDLNLFSYDLSDPDSFYLSGNVFVQEGLFSQDFGSLGAMFQNTFRGIFSREVERYREPIWRQVPLLEHMDFDIGIRARDNVMVQTTAFDAAIDVELQIDLTLRGTLKNPILVGEVKIIDGNITYQNRTFEVQSCSLQFDGENSPTGPLIPRIETCSAEATIERTSTPTRRTSLETEPSGSFASVREEQLQPYRIRVSVEGDSPETLNISLESVNVALDQRDILSLIFTGKTVDELTTSSAEGSSYELLFRQLIDVVESEFQEQLSIDEFTVIPSIAGSTVIQLREQVSERLSVDVETRVFGQETSTQTVTGQLTLFDWLILELSESSDDENNVEMGGRLRLRLEFD